MKLTTNQKEMITLYLAIVAIIFGAIVATVAWLVMFGVIKP